MNSTLSIQQFQDVRNNLQPIIDALVNFFGDDCSPGDRRITNAVIAQNNNCPSVYFNQTTISERASLTREHTNTRIKKLANFLLLGKYSIIAKQYRHRKSCIYYLSSLFNHPEVRSALSKFLPALRWWSYEKALEFALLKKDLTPSNEVNNYIVTSSSKREIFGDKMNKDFKNMAARSQQQAKRETGPPPMTPLERERKRLEIEARTVIALRPVYAEIEAKKSTKLDAKGQQYAENNPFMLEFLATLQEKERLEKERNAPPVVHAQTNAFPKTGWME